MVYSEAAILSQAERMRDVVNSIIVNVDLIRSGIIQCEDLIFEKFWECKVYLSHFKVNLNTKLLPHLNFLVKNYNDEKVLGVCIISIASIKMLKVYIENLEGRMREQSQYNRHINDEYVLNLCRKTEASMKETVEWINGMWESLSLKKDGVLILTPLSLPVKSYVPPLV